MYNYSGMPGELASGSELAGYRIEALIARGGMGAVYRAVQDYPRRTVALKVISAGLAGDERFRERFVRESNIAGAIEHPNIIPIYAAGEADDVLYIAMRYVETLDLGALLRRTEKLDGSYACSLIGQAADALDAAHERGLVHRDVKPANILVDRRPGRSHVYLADFGVTKQLVSGVDSTATGQVIGTLDYVAPEQIRGERVDRRADVYSLGCVLYECLAGTPPFKAENDAAMLWAHIAESPPVLSDQRPDLPAAMDAVIAQALAKSRDDRFPNCNELAVAAEAALSGNGRRDVSTSARGSAAPTMPETPRRESVAEFPAWRHRLRHLVSDDAWNAAKNPWNTLALAVMIIAAVLIEPWLAAAAVVVYGALVAATVRRIRASWALEHLEWRVRVMLASASEGTRKQARGLVAAISTVRRLVAEVDAFLKTTDRRAISRELVKYRESSAASPSAARASEVLARQLASLEAVIEKRRTSDREIDDVGARLRAISEHMARSRLDPIADEYVTGEVRALRDRINALGRALDEAYSDALEKIRRRGRAEGASPPPEVDVG